MNEKFLKLLNGHLEYYPKGLEQNYPRVFEKIVQLWNTPAMDEYLSELMMDTRNGQRQGFPPEIASEILRLSQLQTRQLTASSKDVWSMITEKQRQGVEELGYKFSPQGFMQASESGNMRAVQMFLGSGISLEIRDERNWTPLMISSFNGREAVAFLLIQNGASIHAQDINGYSPIHWAAYNGYGNVVSLLLRSGANANAASNFGWTPLMQAATRGHLLPAAHLVASGADINTVSQDKWTALLKAANNGHADMVRFLLSKGANADIEHLPGMNALSLAIKGRHDEVIALLERK